MTVDLIVTGYYGFDELLLVACVHAVCFLRCLLLVLNLRNVVMLFDGVLLFMLIRIVSLLMFC